MNHYLSDILSAAKKSGKFSSTAKSQEPIVKPSSFILWKKKVHVSAVASMSNKMKTMGVVGLISSIDERS